MKGKYTRPKSKQVSDNINYYYALYKKIHNLTPVAKEAKMERHCLSRIFKKHGLNIYQGGYEKYKYDKTFFNDIDTEAKAYFLGFIFADGFVSLKQRNFLLGIEINTKDIQILEKFKSCIRSNHPIKIDSKRNSCKIRVYGKNMVGQLIKKGCVENKSKILQFPKHSIPDCLMPHFMRGYFDGDGTIAMYHSKKNPNQRPSIVCGIISSYDFALEYMNIMSQKIGINKIKIQKNKGMGTFGYCGINNIQKIYEWLYPKRSTIFLDRKKQKFEKSIEKYLSRDYRQNQSSSFSK